MHRVRFRDFPVRAEQAYNGESVLHLTGGHACVLEIPPM